MLYFFTLSSEMFVMCRQQKIYIKPNNRTLNVLHTPYAQRKTQETRSERIPHYWIAFTKSKRSWNTTVTRSLTPGFVIENDEAHFSVEHKHHV
jgi:hypothetical protein